MVRNAAAAPPDASFTSSSNAIGKVCSNHLFEELARIAHSHARVQCTRSTCAYLCLRFDNSRCPRLRARRACVDPGQCPRVLSADCAVVYGEIGRVNVGIEHEFRASQKLGVSRHRHRMSTQVALKSWL
jgi:hypothetical protein